MRFSGAASIGAFTYLPELVMADQA